MNYDLPYTIDNGLGEKIVFKEILHERDGDRLLTQGTCKPGGGPVMHVHYHQDESFKVIKGSLSYQLPGQDPVHLSEGQSVTVLRNIPHRFWNDGKDELIIEGWIKPAHNVIFFLSTLYQAQKNAGSHRPEIFDAAYLTIRYKNENGNLEIPGFVKNVILPVVYRVGKILGRYKKFKDAPSPL